MSSDKIGKGLTASYLETKWKSNPDAEQRQNPFNLRMRRALSWLARAEQERDDPDAAFIFYWIAFNAAYVENLNDGPEAFNSFFGKIVPRDTPNPIYGALKRNYDPSGPVRSLIQNQFVFRQFWNHSRAANDLDRWENRFESAKKQVSEAFHRGDTHKILDEVFQRLYVLRNQLIHGSATWRGSVNRDQVQDGAAIMTFLVPHFINLMLDNPDLNRGVPHYAAGTKLLPSV